MMTTTTSTTTCPPTSSSDLRQALLALRDLACVTVPTADPALVSALQQARAVLRRHDRRINGPRRAGP